MNSILSSREKSIRKTPVIKKRETLITETVNDTEPSNSDLPKYLRHSRLQLVKDFNHHFILDFGQEMRKQIEMKNEENMKKKIKSIKEHLRRQMDEKRKEAMVNFKIETKREIEEIKNRIESEGNIKLQVLLSKLTDDMLIKNELALKEQREKMVKTMNKTVQEVNENWEKKCEKLISDVRKREQEKQSEILSEEKKNFEKQRAQIKAIAQKEQSEKLSDLRQLMTDKINEEVEKTSLRWEEICQSKILSIQTELNGQINQLKEQLTNTKTILTETRQELDNSLSEKEQLKTSLLEINEKYEYFINTSLNVEESGQCFLVPTPKPVLDIMMGHSNAT